MGVPMSNSQTTIQDEIDNIEGHDAYGYNSAPDLSKTKPQDEGSHNDGTSVDLGGFVLLLMVVIMAQCSCKCIW